MYEIITLISIFVEQSSSVYYKIDWRLIPFMGISLGLGISSLKLFPEIWFGETGSFSKTKRKSLIDQRDLEDYNNDDRPQSEELVIIGTTYKEDPAVVRKNYKNLTLQGFSPSQLIYVSDGCNDDWKKFSTEEFTRRKNHWDRLTEKERSLETLKWYDTGAELIRLGLISKNNAFEYSNGQKVGSQKQALFDLPKSDASPNVKYVGFIDADVLFAGGRIPVEKLEDGKYLGAALNIIPILRQEFQGSLHSRIMKNIQTVEYLISMVVGKIFSSRTGSIGTVSGAFGIFKIEHLKKHIVDETGRFAGDDQQRTLLAILNGGKILFFKNIVYTYCPSTFGELQMQRTQKWWPGLWDNFPKMVRVLFSKQKHIAPRLRIEMLIEGLFIFDVFKILSIFFILYSAFMWQILALVIFYMFIEGLAMWKVRTKVDMCPGYWILPLMLIYRICNMFWRMIGGLQLLDTLVFKTGFIKKFNDFNLDKDKYIKLKNRWKKAK